MENLTTDSWMVIGLMVILLVASVAMALHVIKKYPPEPMPAEDNSEVEPILCSVDDDDD